MADNDPQNPGGDNDSIAAEWTAMIEAAATANVPDAGVDRLLNQDEIGLRWVSNTAQCQRTVVRQLALHHNISRVLCLDEEALPVNSLFQQRVRKQPPLPLHPHIERFGIYLDCKLGMIRLRLLARRGTEGD